MLTLTEASKQVGRSKSALLKAIKQGRLSASKSADGSYSVDPSELFRSFSPVLTPPPEDVEQQAPRPEISAHLERTIEELRAERDYLRDRLTARDRDVERLTLLLAPPRSDEHHPRGGDRIWLVVLVGAVLALSLAGFTLFRALSSPVT